MTAALTWHTESITAYVLPMLLAANSQTSGNMLSKRSSVAKRLKTMSTSLSPHLLSTILKMDQVSSSARFMLNISTPLVLKTAKLLLVRCSGNLSSECSPLTPTFLPWCQASQSTLRATPMFCQESTSEVQHQAQPQLIPSQSPLSRPSLFHHQETTFPLLKLKHHSQATNPGQLISNQQTP